MRNNYDVGDDDDDDLKSFLIVHNFKIGKIAINSFTF